MNTFILKIWPKTLTKTRWVIFTCQKLRNANFIWYNTFCCVITKQKSAVAYKGVLVLLWLQLPKQDVGCSFPFALTDSELPFLPLHLFLQPFHWLPAQWKPSCAWSVTRERKENIFCRKGRWLEEVGVYVSSFVHPPYPFTNSHNIVLQGNLIEHTRRRVSSSWHILQENYFAR